MSQYEDDRSYGRNTSPYGPVRRYGPNPRPRNVFARSEYISSRMTEAMDSDTVRSMASRLKNEIDPCWLDEKLRTMGVPAKDRIHLFSIIEEEQESQRRKERIEMTATELIEYWSNFEGSRLRMRGAYLNNGWLTDVMASNQRSKYQSDQDILVVHDGKAHYFLPGTIVTVWPNYVDDEE